MTGGGAGFYLSGSIGAHWADLDAISGTDLLPQSARADTAGVGFSIAGGAHLSHFFVGARGTVGLGGAYDLYSMVFEGGARAPLPLFDDRSALSVRFGFGWAWLNHAGYAEAHDLDGLLVQGPVVELGTGADVWLGDDVTLGLSVDGLLLFPSRGASTCEMPGTMGECVVDGFDFATTGRGVGLGARLRLELGVHF
jgi:hypothetical protein